MIPETPLGWSRITLGEIGSFNTSSVDKLIDQNQQIIPLVNYLDVFKNTHLDSLFPYSLTSVTPSKLEKFSLRRGDILFTPSSETYDEIGYSAVITEDFEAVHSYHTVRLRPSGDFPLDIRFSGYFLNAEYVLNQFSKLASGATRKTLKLSDFSNTEVLIPDSLIEQRNIAKILDSAMNRIANLSRLINKLEMMREGMLEDLLTLGVRDDGSLRDPEIDEFQETEIGRIPHEWTISKVSEISQSNVGIVVTPAKYYTDFGVITLRGTNIKDGGIDLSNVKYMGMESHEKNLSSALCPGDVVVVRSGQPGLSAVIPESIPISNCVDLLICRVNEDINAFYLSYYINSIAKRRVSAGSHGSVQQHFNLGKLRDLIIAHPVDTEEQNRIVNSVRAIENQINAKMKLIEKLNNIKTGLQNDLLTGAHIISNEMITQMEAMA